MTFKKIDENTIRCVLTEDDMEENDIGLEDFFSSNREKIHNFLETIMERAKEEIGYENDGSVLSMQLMPLPRNGLAITITGSRDDELGDVLGNVQNILKSMKDQIDLEDELEEACGKVREITPASCRVFRFVSLSAVEDYCQEVSQFARNLKTSLYRDTDGAYYMQISKGRSSRKIYEKACLEAAEYAMVTENGDLFAAHMSEHFEKIISKKVIEYLG